MNLEFCASTVEPSWLLQSNDTDLPVVKLRLLASDLILNGRTQRRQVVVISDGLSC